MTFAIVQLVYLSPSEHPCDFVLCNLSDATFDRTWPSLVALGAGMKNQQVHGLETSPRKPWEEFESPPDASLTRNIRVAKAVVWTIKQSVVSLDPHEIPQRAEPGAGGAQPNNSIWVVDLHERQVVAMGSSIEEAKRAYDELYQRFRFPI